MRDPNRIDNILEELGELWKQYPDLRLGQLIANTRIQENEKVFYNIEDQSFIDFLKQCYRNWQK